MIGLRKNFADVPPDVRFQISWLVCLLHFANIMRLANRKTQDGYSSRLYGNDKAHLPICPIYSAHWILTRAA